MTTWRPPGVLTTATRVFRGAALRKQVRGLWLSELGMSLESVARVRARRYLLMCSTGRTLVPIEAWGKCRQVALHLVRRGRQARLRVAIEVRPPPPR